MAEQQSRSYHSLARINRSDQGFTFFEVLVAFLIAAMVVATVVHLTSSSVAATRIAGRYDEAVSRAQSHLALSGALPLVESDRQGDEADGFHWHIVVKAPEVAHLVAHPATRGGANPAGLLTLYRILVTISWREDGGSRGVELSSARLGPLG